MSSTLAQSSDRFREGALTEFIRIDEAKGRFGTGRPAGFIQKPYRPEQLMAEIGRCLGERPA